jgi:hypothetical protein
VSIFILVGSAENYVTLSNVNAPNIPSVVNSLRLASKLKYAKASVGEDPYNLLVPVPAVVSLASGSEASPSSAVELSSFESMVAPPSDPRVCSLEMSSFVGN